jgi:hypothetical protein
MFIFSWNSPIVTNDMSLLYFTGPHTAELSKIERIGVISVLEDCTDQLYILRKTNRTKTFPTDLKYRSLKERYMHSDFLNLVC